MKTNWMKSWVYAALTASCLVMLTESLAAAQSFVNVPGEVMDSFIRDTGDWWGQLRNFALSIFALALTIDICLFGIRMALQRSDLGEIFGQFINLMLFAAFIFVVIDNYENWAKAVAITGLENVAKNLTPVNATLDKPVEMASHIWLSAHNIIMAVSDISHFPKLFLYIVTAMILIVALFYLVAIMILVKCEFYIVANAGVLIIGLGGSKIFKDYAVNVMRYVLSLGIKIFVIQLLANIGMSSIAASVSQLASGLTQGNGGLESLHFNIFLILLVKMIILVILAKTLPDSCMALLSGAAIGGGNPLAAAGMAAGRAAGGAALGAVTAGAGAALGAAGALKNSYTVARGAGATGLGGTMAGMGRAILDARQDAKAGKAQKAVESDPGSLLNHLRSSANSVKAERRSAPKTQGEAPQTEGKK